MSRTLKVTLAYDGTGYVGWQRQARGVSVQGLVEEALSRLEGSPVTIVGAGRTDAGVHALGQVASARVTTALDAPTILRALNAMLPPDVRACGVEDAAAGFHARYGATAKTYRYRIRQGGVLSPFEHRWCWHVPGRLDLPAMSAAAAALVGTHDFKVFMSTGSGVRTSTRTVRRADWRPGAGPLEWPADVAAGETTASAEGGALAMFEIEADGFLRHMVRAIVGTLVEIGEGRRAPGSMNDLLRAGDRSLAGATAPPGGLFLVRVAYGT